MGFPWTLCMATALSQWNTNVRAVMHVPPAHLIGHHNYVEVHGGFGQTIVPFLGDRDRRTNTSIGVIFAKTERRLNVGQIRGTINQELYFEHSSSPGGSGKGDEIPSQYNAVGYLYGIRYYWPAGAYNLYGDFGLGLQYNNHRTWDLPSRLNSTPYLGFGVVIPNRDHPIFAGFRILHISNGGTVPENRGQTQFFFDLGVKF